MPENCVVYSPLILMMDSFRILWRIRVESWRFRCQQQCLAEPNAKSTGKPAALRKIVRKIRLHCRSRRIDEKRMEGTLHKGYIAGRGINSLNHYNIVHKIYSSASSNHSTRCKQQWIEELDNLKRYLHGSWRKSEKKGDRWSKEPGQNSTFVVVNGHLSSREFGIETTILKIQRQRSTPRWHCERWFRIVCCIHLARITSITFDGSNCNGCHSNTTRIRRTSSRRSICLYPGQKWKMLQNCWKPQNGRCEICTVILWQDYDGHGNSIKFYRNTVGKRFQIGNVFSYTEKKDFSCLCMWTK